MTGPVNLALGLALVWGLLIGSFVNVLIHRLPRMIMGENTTDKEAVRYDLCWPASHCPSCRAPLKKTHLIPLLSYVALKGRCGFCQHPIGPRYPIIEATNALIWLTCVWHWGFNPSGISWALFASTLLALAVIDWQTTLLPDDLTQALLWMGMLAAACAWIPVSPTQSILGAAVGYTSLWCVATLFERFTGKQGMGAGDFKFLAALGAWLGPVALVPVVLFASLSGAAVGLYLKWRQRLNEDGHIPFGPFLAAGGMTVAVFGTPLSIWAGG